MSISRGGRRPVPTTVRAAGAGVALAFAVAACGGSSGGAGTGAAGSPSAAAPSASPSPSPSPSPTLSLDLTAANVGDALLTSDDLPMGYVKDPASNDSTSPSGCPALDALDLKADSTVRADVSFSKGDTGPFVSETIAVQPGKLADNFRRFASALDSCKTFSDPDGVSYMLSPLSIPTVGEETQAFRVVGDAQGTKIAADLVAFRVGDTAFAISNAAVGEVDSMLTAQIANRALAKARASAG